MADSAKARALILAAGGIVVREGARPRIAIVRLRHDKSWVLPKGKLLPGEQPIAAAKREVVEETGHNVSVHEFLGSMSYSFDGKIKIVQFWLMRATSGPMYALMSDIKEVKWVSLKQAVDTLTRAHEKVFLANVGPIALKSARQSSRVKPAKPSVRGRSKPRARLRRAPVAPAEHPVTNDYAGPAQNTFAKMLGGWVGRIAHPSARRIG
jgi:8-oxo-dGTP diphosphatase